jgi:hypothetical protein
MSISGFSMAAPDDNGRIWTTILALNSTATTALPVEGGPPSSGVLN